MILLRCQRNLMTPNVPSSEKRVALRDINLRLRLLSLVLSFADKIPRNIPMDDRCHYETYKLVNQPTEMVTTSSLAFHENRKWFGTPQRIVLDPIFILISQFYQTFKLKPFQLSFE